MVWSAPENIDNLSFKFACSCQVLLWVDSPPHVKAGHEGLRLLAVLYLTEQTRPTESRLQQLILS